MAETVLKSKLVVCPTGSGRMLVDINLTCKRCPYFQEIQPKDAQKGIVEKVHCIVPSKYYKEVFELNEIDFVGE